MDAVCEDKENEEHHLERCEGGIGCNYDRGGWARRENGGDEVREEGCHGGSGKTQFRSGRRGFQCLGTESRRISAPIRNKSKFSARSFAIWVVKTGRLSISNL